MKKCIYLHLLILWSKSAFSKFNYASDLPVDLLKYRFGGIPSSFWFSTAGWGLGICLSNKFPKSVILVVWGPLFWFRKHSSSCFFFLNVEHFKVFTEFVTTLLLFYVFFLFRLGGTWGLSSLTRDWICTPSARRRSLNHWTTREDPRKLLSQRWCENHKSSTYVLGCPQSCRTRS